MKRALLVIDVQNEYFPGGQLPITHPHAHLDNILRVMDSATDAGLPVVVVQHTFTQPEMPFFKRGTPGLGAAPGGGLASARPLDREEPPRQLHRHGPGRVVCASAGSTP